jgi:uncharacterized protein
MVNEVFLDTAYAIALSAPADLFHQQAVRLANDLVTQNTRLITTRAVTLEIGNALSKQRYRAAAVKLLTALDSDPKVEIVSVSDALYENALKLFRERPDKEWGITDCISFIVMQERGITNALTTDEHFQQAGFNVLMR